MKAHGAALVFGYPWLNSVRFGRDTIHLEIVNHEVEVSPRTGVDNCDFGCPSIPVSLNLYGVIGSTAGLVDHRADHEDQDCQHEQVGKDSGTRTHFPLAHESILTGRSPVDRHGQRPVE